MREARPSDEHGERADGQPSVAPPTLLPAAPLDPRHLVLAAAACAGVLFMSWRGPSTSNHDQAARNTGAPKIVRVEMRQVPGFMHGVDPVTTQGSSSWLNLVDMPDPEKDRLKQSLKDSRLRVGAVTIWDTVHQDGDRVRISSAGFSQDVTILHKPRMFFVPYLPGAAVRIEATFDGGGGVTLGVRTAIGDVPLPYLSVGQVLELPLP